MTRRGICCYQERPGGGANNRRIWPQEFQAFDCCFPSVLFKTASLSNYMLCIILATQSLPAAQLFLALAGRGGWDGLILSCVDDGNDHTLFIVCLFVFSQQSAAQFFWQSSWCGSLSSLASYLYICMCNFLFALYLYLCICVFVYLCICVVFIFVFVFFVFVFFFTVILAIKLMWLLP